MSDRTSLFSHPLLFFLIPILVFSGCRGSHSHDQAEETTETRPVNLKLVSLYFTGAPILGENIVYLTGRVREATDDKVNIKVYDPGKLVGSMEVLDAVSDGKVDMGYATAGFWMGKIPAAPLFSAVPFGPDASEYMAWFFHGNGSKLYQEMYDRYGYNVKVLVCAMIPPETSGWFAHPIESADDLKGMKMRFFGLGGTVMKQLDVAVNVLPPGEIFPALEKRVIDATEYAMPSIDEDKGFYKIVKYNYFPGWHQQTSAFELLINKDVWNKLSPSQQAIIEMACRETIVMSIAKAEATQAAVMKRNEEEHGVTNMTWSPEMLKVYREAWEKVAAEESAADPFFKKVYDDFTAFRKEYAIWGGKAYLPRPSSK